MTDERYKQIMAEIGMPDSHSLLTALKQVANEVAQSERERLRLLIEERALTYEQEAEEKDVRAYDIKAEALWTLAAEI